jgi:hypothetical protein
MQCKKPTDKAWHEPFLCETTITENHCWLAKNFVVGSLALSITTTVLDTSYPQVVFCGLKIVWKIMTLFLSRVFSLTRLTN